MSFATVQLAENDQQGYKAQREDLLQSLANNPDMLDDFWQFLEFKRNQNDPTISKQQNLQVQQQLNFGKQPNSSTPKRGRPLNDSSGSTSAAPKQWKPNNYIQPDNYYQPNNYNQPNSMHEPATHHQQSVSTRITETNQQLQGKRLPFEQLKYAVSSNLPCFLVEYDTSTPSRNLPSAITASKMIEDHFRQQDLRMGNFTLVGWAGKRLKLGVNNKEDYISLFTTDKWPTTINNIAINICKPKFIPDAFALVVRYVPQDMEIEFVEEEIKRTIASADNIKQIRYTYNRKSNDFRFNVTDLREYNSAIELGRISIGNRLLAISPFLTGNRMTYCTRCWQIGHMREKCSSTAQRCRLCLEDFVTKETHTCSNQPKCAQCGGNHHSLDSQCDIIRQYRADLKENVNSAIEKGKLQRIEPFEQPKSKFDINTGEFPPLQETTRPSRQAWGRNPIKEVESTETVKSLLLINEKLVVMTESNKRIEDTLEKIDTKLNQTALDANLHQAALIKILDTTLIMIEKVIWPISAQTNHLVLEGTFGLQEILNTFASIRKELYRDYNTRRQRASSPLGKQSKQS